MFIDLKNNTSYLLVFLCTCVISLSLVFSVHAQQNLSGSSNQVITRVGDALIDQKPGGNFVYFCQGNTQWKNTDIISGGFDCGYGEAGCGPTSIAMVIDTLSGKNLTPVDIGQQIAPKWFDCAAGTHMKDILDNTTYFQDQGFMVSTNMVTGGGRGLVLDLGRAQSELGNGNKYIIGSSQTFPIVNCAGINCNLPHIFVVDKVDAGAGTVHLRDPNACSYSDGNDEKTDRETYPVNAFDWAYAYAIGRK